MAIIIFRLKIWLCFFILQFPIFSMAGILEAMSWAALGLCIYLLFEEFFSWPQNGIEEKYYV